jgi:hypothetical protein
MDLAFPLCTSVSSVVKFLEAGAAWFLSKSIWLQHNFL